MKKILISQPRYFPFIPFLQRLQIADVFVVLDDVQFNRNVFINRCLLSVDEDKDDYLTIPVKHTGERITIRDAEIAKPFIQDHANKLLGWYGDKSLFEAFAKNWMDNSGFGLDLILHHMMCRTIEMLEIDGPAVIQPSSHISYDREKNGADMILEICRSVGGTHYINGGAGDDYGIHSAFADSGISVIDHDMMNHVTGWKYGWLHHVLTGSGIIEEELKSLSAFVKNESMDYFTLATV